MIFQLNRIKIIKFLTKNIGRKAVALSGCKIAYKYGYTRLYTITWFNYNKKTGTPKQLAHKLDISERSINYYIAFLRNELKAPIIYDRKLETYLYETECKLCFVN